MPAHHPPTADFAADTVPMPVVVMIVTGTSHVQEDASETGMSEMCLHNGPMGWNCRLLVIVVFTIRRRFASAILQSCRRHFP
jgi:hypothetical protein